MAVHSDRRRIENYIPRLYGYAFSLCGDVHDAHDLVQETALKALNSARVPDDEPAYRAWLFKILRNTWLDVVRRRSRRLAVVENGADYESIGTPVWAHDDSLISSLTVKLCLTKLSPAHREVLGLVDVSGFSYGEAAVILDVPVGTVTSRVARARNAMLAHLASGNILQFPAERQRQEAL
ncbi:MAG: RNA polymerase sigma factor [Alphaproteobacteria bacterium]|nr:RNA polymerase sigma factor [Alphaproteobacteria bacterium]